MECDAVPVPSPHLPRALQWDGCWPLALLLSHGGQEGADKEKCPQNRLFRLPQMPQQGTNSWRGSRAVSGQCNPFSRIIRRELIISNESWLDIPQPDQLPHPSIYRSGLIGSSVAAANSF